MTPGANFGDGVAVFEAVHGTAPDIAGRGVANPLAMILSGVMMLEHLGRSRGDASCTDAAARVRRAAEACLLAGDRTRDLGGSLGTTAFTDALLSRMER